MHADIHYNTKSNNYTNVYGELLRFVEFAKLSQRIHARIHAYSPPTTD